MNTIEVLKCLANGIDPETGEELPKDSIAHKPEIIRAFYKLVDELSSRQIAVKRKQTDSERIQKNIEMGRPPRSHFPWTEQERSEIELLFKSGHSVEDLSAKFQRTPVAVAIQLEKMELITKEQCDSYRPIT